MATLPARQQATAWTTEQAARPQVKPVATSLAQPLRPAVDWGQVLHLVQYPPLVTFLTTALTAALVLAGHDWGLALPIVLGLGVLWRGRGRPGDFAPNPPKTHLDRIMNWAGAIGFIGLAASFLAYII